MRGSRAFEDSGQAFGRQAAAGIAAAAVPDAGSFTTGMLVWVFTTCSGLGVYERFLFTDRAVQAVVLLMVVPLLLAMGAPVTVLVEAGPERHRRRLRVALAGRL